MTPTTQNQTIYTVTGGCYGNSRSGLLECILENYLNDPDVNPQQIPISVRLGAHPAYFKPIKGEIDPAKKYALGQGLVPALKNAYGDSMGENRERLRKIIERAENYQRKTVTPEDVLPADMGLYAVRHVRDIQLAQAGLDPKENPHHQTWLKALDRYNPQYREHPYYTRDLDDTAGSIAWVRGEIGAPMEGNTPAGKKPNEYPYFDLHGNMAMAGSPEAQAMEVRDLLTLGLELAPRIVQAAEEKLQENV
ncbi:MAG: hypothetical protein AABX47_01610 [Nanoarchaeota archaeon]